MKSSSSMSSPGGLTAVAIFLLLGAVTASLAGTTLLWRGTALDRMWTLNPYAHRQLAPLGKAVGVLFLALGGTLAAASAGWFRRRLWGWWLAVIVVATQALGDLVNTLRGRVFEGLIGVAIAGALLFYLLRSKTRAAFAGGSQTSNC